MNAHLLAETGMDDGDGPEGVAKRAFDAVKRTAPDLQTGQQMFAAQMICGALHRLAAAVEAGNAILRDGLRR